jgi:hypothetical protein
VAEHDAHDEIIAFISAGGAAPSDLAEHAAALGDPTVVRIIAWNRVVILVPTDEDVERLRNGPEHERWAETLWQRFSARAVPRSIPRDLFRVQLDSQQNFEQNYAGSSYYYWL